VPRPLRLDFAGAVYHVVARGNEKKAIFRDDGDRREYLARLAACCRRFEFRLYAFCLMGNHVHLALERGPVELSRIMLTLQSSYAQAFNRRHQRVGHLFQGRYKAFLIEKDAYLLTLVRYIHMNPVKGGLAVRSQAYPWSSDRFYRGGEAPPWLDTATVMAMLRTDRAHRAAHYAQLMAVNDDEYEAIRPSHAAIVGTETFVKEALRNTDVRPEPRPWPIQLIAAYAAAAGGLTLEELRKRGRSVGAAHLRSVAAYLAREYAAIPVCRSARFFGREESTLVRSVLRLEASLPLDPILNARVRDVVVALQSQECTVDPSRKSGMHG